MISQQELDRFLTRLMVELTAESSIQDIDRFKTAVHTINDLYKKKIKLIEKGEHSDGINR